MKGMLDTLVLAVLEEHKAHGYAIGARLAELGVGEVAAGTLYPVLKKLDTAGLVATEWFLSDSGPARKVYELTPQGRTELGARRELWIGNRAIVDRVIGTGAGVAS